MKKVITSGPGDIFFPFFWDKRLYSYVKIVSLGGILHEYRTQLSKELLEDNLYETSPMLSWKIKE